MFNLDVAPIEKAIERAKALRPKVRMIQFGMYEVLGSQGNAYTVRCHRDAHGAKIVECSCPTRDGVACRHSMAAVSLHIAMAAQRQAASL